MFRLLEVPKSPDLLDGESGERTWGSDRDNHFSCGIPAEMELPAFRVLYFPAHLQRLDFEASFVQACKQARFTRARNLPRKRVSKVIHQ